MVTGGFVIRDEIKRRVEEAAETRSEPSKIVGVITLTVTASVLLHGVTSAFLARRYGEWFQRADMEAEERAEMEMTGLTAEDLPMGRWDN